ncbi:MAG: PEP-CTERM sorting domain-containing protein [Verrucomicrobiota bacterium]|nr:PEP-CTERM sorting domain-containing protein [Verrucomicrobiota bacterium]
MLTFAIGAAFLSFAGLCAADTSFGTGANWQISLNNGGSYAPPDALSSRTLPDGSTATGIAGGNPFNVTDRYYRFSFNLTEVTASAKTFFVTNTLFGLLVNGNAVDLSAVMNSGPNTNNFSPSTGLSIPGFFFQLGSNTILFETHSLTGGNAGDPFLAARVDIRAVPEPSTWAMMLGGGGLFLAVQRLRRRGG